MNKIFEWLLFSFPTTLAYSFECFGATQLALALYKPIAKAGYAPAMYHLGWMLSDFMNDDSDLETGKIWIQKAADKGHKESADWIKQFNDLDPKTGDLLRQVVNSMPRPKIKVWEVIRPFIGILMILLLIITYMGN
jgi:hypothetical protein